MSDPDRAAIVAALARCVAGWNTGSGEAFASIFTEASDYVHIGGGILRGRKANADQHQKLFEGPFKGATIAIDVLSVRFLRLDVALVHTRSHNFRGEVETGSGVQSWVFVKDAAGAWLAESFQNTVVPKDSPHAP